MNNKGEHKFLKSTSLLLQSEALMIAMVYPMKRIINAERPDGGYHSFPSGHTAQAFVAATFLHKEYGHKSPWYSVAGYTMASAVGMCRMISNRHWASDVLVGAGIGVLSTNLVYLCHKHRKNKTSQKQLIAMPSYNRGPGFYLSMRL
jgi:membrane-associated phospholipid phosphatase